MNNDDLIELFDQVPAGAPVNIVEHSQKERMRAAMMAAVMDAAGGIHGAPMLNLGAVAATTTAATHCTQAYPNPRAPGQPWVKVGVRSQTLSVFSRRHTLEKRYDISTAKRGVGETQNSYQTPRGWHRICEKSAMAHRVTPLFFAGSHPLEIYPELHAEYPNKDWILTRILWLCGQEPGLNQGSRDGVLVNSYARYIYIHGAGRHVPMGTPTSLGCVRMTSEAVIELFEHACRHGGFD